MSENNDLVKSKNAISSYLHAATEIERDIYTIESTCDELENKAKELDYELEDMSYCSWNRVSYWEDLKKSYNENISHARENCKSKMKPIDLRTNYTARDIAPKSKFIGISIFITYIVIIALIIVNAIVEVEDPGAFFTVGVLFGWLPGLIIGRIAMNVNRAKDAEAQNLKNASQNVQNKRENERVIKDYIEEQKKEIENCQKEIENKKIKIKSLNEKAQEYRNRIAQIKDDAKPLYANRDRFYSAGIVPPDYRTIDCVYVLDQIFRNDLADTMRDAVLLYEERAFRGELIRGINNIVAHMDKLSSLLSGLGRDIKSIKLDVTSMCDNMDKIYAQNRINADDAARDRERIYEQTKLHGFTLDAIEESSRKIEDYVYNRK